MARKPFDKLDNKIKARERLVETYRHITGLPSIPKGRQYWTLCGSQSLRDGAEIVQLSNLGFLQKNQFYGVDKNSRLISANSKRHPEAYWCRGWWNKTIQEFHRRFLPSAIYLDTEYIAWMQRAIDITKFTMVNTPPECVLFVNVMLNNPHSGEKCDPQQFIDLLTKEVSPRILSVWKDWGAHYLYSCTGETLMGTYVFSRGF